MEKDVQGLAVLGEARETDLAGQMPRSRRAEINATWGGVKKRSV